jgi:hypothetical protein
LPDRPAYQTEIVTTADGVPGKRKVENTHKPWQNVICSATLDLNQKTAKRAHECLFELTFPAPGSAPVELFKKKYADLQLRLIFSSLPHHPPIDFLVSTRQRFARPNSVLDSGPARTSVAPGIPMDENIAYLRLIQCRHVNWLFAG